MAAHQLFLLADHLKLSLLERQRALSLSPTRGLQSPAQDSHIQRSLSQFQRGLAQLDAAQAELGEAETAASGLARLKQQYADLYAQFHRSAPPAPAVEGASGPARASNSAVAHSRPSRAAARNRNVRFRDNLDEDDGGGGGDEDDGDDEGNGDDDDVEAQATRAALFSGQERYRDEPEAPDPASMDNPHVHAYHKQVLRDQDDQLDVLGQSIGRQRMLGMQMSNELDEQLELLDEVERGVDRHSATLNTAQKRLGTIARKARDNWNWLTITILVIVLILLVVVLK